MTGLDNGHNGAAAGSPRTGWRRLLGERSVRAKLMGIAAVGTLSVVAVGAAGVYGFDEVRRASDESRQLAEAQLLLTEAEADRHAVEVAALAAVLAEPGSLEHGQARQQLSDAAVAMRTAMKNATTQDVGAALEAAVVEQRVHFEEFATRAQALTETVASDPETTTDELAAFGELAKNLELSQGRVTEQLGAAAAAAETHASSVEATARRGITILGAVAAVLVVVLAFLLGRSVVTALRRLGRTTAAITAGDLDARTEIVGRDEIGILGQDLNSMAVGLHDLFARLEEEARRDAFSSQLAEAFELADTEPDAFEQVRRAMAAISSDLPMELLLADASQASMERVASNPDAGAPGCGVDTPFSCLAVRRGGPTVFESSEALNACPKLRDRPDGPCAAACVPVTFMGRALGVLHTTAPEGSPPAPQQMVKLTALATQAGSSVGTVRATATTQLQASTDGLTGLINRRTLENELHRLTESRKPYALAMADLDHFKKINDTFGHDAGDRALRLFAEVMRGSLRDDDLVGRYGGEEFVIVLPGQSAVQARNTLERLRTELAGTQAADSGTPRFTASYGLSDSDAGVSIEAVIRSADRALATAKEEGRDRIVVAREPLPNPEEPVEPAPVESNGHGDGKSRVPALDQPERKE